jgi:hypothetical protein
MSTALVRGTVRLAHGRHGTAEVRIDELNVVSRVRDGQTFSFRVPPGHYTLTVSAPGERSQTRAIDVGAGEQAIYDILLEGARR